MIVALLMGVAGSLVQYYLPPDSEFTANIIPSIPFVFVVISLIVNIVRSGRVNEEEGVGGALDRAITPHGGSRLAASVDVENLVSRSSTSASRSCVFAVVCLLAVDLQAVLARAARHRRRPRDRVPRRTRSSPVRAACSGSARSPSPASAPSATGAVRDHARVADPPRR